MPAIHILTAAEQVANHLRNDISNRVWTGKIPGGAALARELGVGRMTVDVALELLEKEGLLISQGAGRSRLISESATGSSSLKVAILPYLIEDSRSDYVMDIQRLLRLKGHNVIFPRSSISDLGANVTRLAKLVEETQADAWVVIAGTKDLLSWFAEHSIPTFALFGRRRGLSVASIGPDKEKAHRSLVRKMVQLGHRRITLITRPLRRLPEPGLPERAFLDELKLSGIQASSYHLPDWDGETETLPRLLDNIFHITPPTVVVVDEPPIFFSVQHHLARRGILAPEHVSLICTDWDPYFNAQIPSVAHITWDSRPWVRRVVRWVNGVSQGKVDQRQSLTKAEFVEGGSIGPVK